MYYYYKLKLRCTLNDNDQFSLARFVLPKPANFVRNWPHARIFGGFFNAASAYFSLVMNEILKY